MPVVRLLIADDVGIGKTIEAGLIASETARAGRDATASRAVLAQRSPSSGGTNCARSSRIDAELVLPSTVDAAGARRCAPTSRCSSGYPYTVVSTDFIKSETRRAQFLRTCPELVIVDEAHTCVAAERRAGGDQQRATTCCARSPGDRDRHLILVTATPHSGKRVRVPRPARPARPRPGPPRPGSAAGPRAARPAFVQRRRRDIRSYLDEETPFPRDRQIREVPYSLTGDYAHASAGRFSPTPARPSRRLRACSETRPRCGSGCAGGRRSRCSAPSPHAPRRRCHTAVPGRPTLAADHPGGSRRARPHQRARPAATTRMLEGTDPAPGAEDDYLPDSARRPPPGAGQGGRGP